MGSSALGLGEPLRFVSSFELHYLNDMKHDVELLVHTGTADDGSSARSVATIRKDELMSFDKDELEKWGVDTNASFFFRMQQTHKTPWYRRAYGHPTEKLFRLSALPELAQGDF